MGLVVPHAAARFAPCTHLDVKTLLSNMPVRNKQRLHGLPRTPSELWRKDEIGPQALYHQSMYIFSNGDMTHHCEPCQGNTRASSDTSLVQQYVCSVLKQLCLSLRTPPMQQCSISSQDVEATEPQHIPCCGRCIMHGLYGEEVTYRPSDSKQGFNATQQWQACLSCTCFNMVQSRPCKGKSL